MEKIIPSLIEEEMKSSYIDYAMSVIVSRALPDAKDGLKPVHRRILYAMHDMGMFHNKPFKKCARIVGEVLGKYHPHGDTAVYDSLARMVQPFSLRYTLIRGQGNFGSIDGDSPAAMRYCITGESLVNTEKGLMPIKDISNKKEGKINLKIINYKGQKKKAVKFFNSGKHQIIEIKTKQGYSIRGSANHPLLCWVYNEFGIPTLCWKRLDEISKSDYLVMNRNFSLFSKENEEFKQYYPKLNKKNKKTELPKIMNKQLAFLLGALVAEGSFHQNKIIFSNKDLEYYNECKKAFENNFKGISFYEREIKGNCKEFEVYHQNVVKFIKNIGLKAVKSDKKEIPFSILRSKKEFVKEFVKGLFEGDGSIRYIQDKRHQGKSLQLTYDSKSKKLISQLKILLLNFGITTIKPYKDKRNDCYKLIIPGVNNVKKFKEQIGFYSKRKKEILAKADTMNSSRMSKIDFIPLISNYIRKNYNNAFLNKNNFDRYNNIEKNYSKLKKILLPFDFRMIDWLLKHKYFFDKVEDIDYSDHKENVYSIKVDSKCHSFVANGFINHNTEAKMNKLSEEMLKDIDKETVRWRDNFDGTLKEPVVLPAKIPNLLVNGSSGIAVGMATNIPPHNLNEICGASIALLDNSELELKDLIQYVKGPDFPTGAEIVGTNGIMQAYATGRGKVRIRAIVDKEEGRLIIKAIPYMVNKAGLIEQIADLVKAKKVEGIRNIRDESNRKGMRVVIELKQGANEDIVLNKLFRYSRLKTTFGIINLALVNNQPKVMSLKTTLQIFLNHRKDVITKRTEYDLKKAKARAHILEGILVALKDIDNVIKTIKQSSSVSDAKEKLIANYELSEDQAKAILEMKLQKLASLEREKTENEHKELIEKIKDLEDILANDERVKNIIKEELNEIKEKYGDERKTIICKDEECDFEIESLIEDTPQAITFTKNGYVKRIDLSTYKTQRRGGKGITATKTREEDVVEDIFIASNRTQLLFFTDKGQVHWSKVYKLPSGSRESKGKPIVNVLGFKDEKVTKIIPISDFEKDKFLFMTTKKGIVKKCHMEEFEKPRKGGKRAISLDEDDELISVQTTDGEKEILIGTRKGTAIHFHENKVRCMGRTARGVRGIYLKKGDYVINAIVSDNGKEEVFTMTDKGYGKKSPINQYRLTNRGGKGVKNIKLTEKNGKVIGFKLIDNNPELMFITKKGITMRTRSSEISTIGRATQGVRVMRLSKGDEVVSVEVIDDYEQEE